MYTADAIVFFGLALTIMLQIDVSLTIVALLPYPILAVLIRSLGKRLHAHYESIQEAFATLNTKVQENLSGVRVVKAYTLEASEVEHFGGTESRVCRTESPTNPTDDVLLPALPLSTGDRGCGSPLDGGSPCH